MKPAALLKGVMSSKKRPRIAEHMDPHIKATDQQQRIPQDGDVMLGKVITYNLYNKHWFVKHMCEAVLPMKMQKRLPHDLWVYILEFVGRAIFSFRGIYYELYYHPHGFRGTTTHYIYCDANDPLIKWLGVF